MGPCLSENLLGALLEGRLELDRSDGVEQHLDACAACRALVAAATETLASPPLLSTAAATPRARRAEPDADEPVVPGSRYQLRRLLGSGGMGSVYLAHDPRLDREIALKLLLPSQSLKEQEELRHRLLHEAQAMARLSHPNVTHVYDVVSLGGRLAIAMELVDGTTLRQWLKERREAAPSLSLREVLPLLRQAGAGLAAAHAAGLVHRDVKPDNVLVGKDGVVRVTDFGLARASEAPALESEGTLVGTPAYMAPEQLAGQPADARSDCFAFAVMAWEALYGERPFAGSTVEELAQEIARDRVRPPPRGARVPERVRRALLAALASEPSARVTSIAALLEALEPARPRARLGLALALVTALVAAVLIAQARAPRRARPPLHRGALAVLGFRELGGAREAAWLSGALTELLDEDLAAGEQLAVRSGDSVSRMKGDLAIASGGSGQPGEPGGPGGPGETLSRVELERVRRYLGVDWVVYGGYRLVGGRLALTARLQETASGAVLATLTDEEAADAPRALAARVAERLRGVLGVGAPPAVEAGALGAAFPSDPEVARGYVEGLERLRLLDARGAVERLTPAAARSPDGPLPHAALARALSALGRTAEAQREARLALDLSGSSSGAGLSRKERLSTEALFHELAHDWPRVVEINRALFTFFPDEVEYGLRLADAQVRSGATTEALATLEALRRLPPPASRHPRLGLIEGNAYAQRSDFAHVLEAARRAAADARAEGARLAEVTARSSEAWALVKLGDVARAQPLLEEVRRGFHELGDLGHEALQLNALGVLASDRGDLEEARRLFTEMLALARSVGNEEWVALALGNYTAVLVGLGDLKEAQPLYEEQLERLRARPGHWAEGTLEMMLGDVKHQRGDLPGAERAYLHALEPLARQSNREESARDQQQLVWTLLERGELERAQRVAEESVAAATATGGGPLIGECRVALGAALLARGRSAEARAELRRALSSLDGDGERDRRLRALSWLARAELQSGRSAEARRVADEAEALGRRSSTRAAVLAAQSAVALVRGLTGGEAERDAARARLREVIAFAEPREMVALGIAARLDLGTIEQAVGQRAAGRAQLAALAREAERRGFLWIARRARHPGPLPPRSGGG